MPGKTIPATLGNPLYHWTHFELQRYFGITDLLSASTADAVFGQNCRTADFGRIYRQQDSGKVAGSGNVHH